MATVTAYLRVSTDRQTLENQRSEIIRFTRLHDLSIDRWVEETISGKVKDSDRKLGCILRRLQKGDTLIVTELSRLSRTLLDIMNIMRGLLETGVTLYSVKENFCLADNINSKVVLFAFGLAAEIERDMIATRTKEALAARKEQGKILGHRTGVCPKMEYLKSIEKDIVRDYSSGMFICDLSEKYGVSRGTMSKFLKDRDYCKSKEMLR